MKHILVVDDHSGIRLLLEEVLKLEGYKVTTTHSGKEALILLENIHVDLLIVDQHLQDKKGIQFIQEVAHRFTNVSVILISGLTTNLYAYKDEYSFIKAVIEKPFHIDV